MQRKYYRWMNETQCLRIIWKMNHKSKQNVRDGWIKPNAFVQLEPLFFFFFPFSFPFSKIKTRRNFRHHQCHKMTLDEIISFPPLALSLQSHSLHPLGKPSLWQSEHLKEGWKRPSDPRKGGGGGSLFVPNNVMVSCGSSYCVVVVLCRGVIEPHQVGLIRDSVDRVELKIKAFCQSRLLWHVLLGDP